MDRVFVVFQRGIDAPDLRVLHVDLGSDDYKLDVCEQIKNMMDIVPEFSLLACVSECQTIVVTRDEWRAFLHG